VDPSEEKNLLPMPGIEPRLIGRQSCSQVSVPITLSELPLAVVLEQEV